MVAFIAGTICLSMPSINHVSIGMTRTDMNNTELSGRIERSNKILQAFTSATKIYPVMDMTKSDIYEMLPVELREMSWSCRRPIYKDNTAISCNQCPTCKELEQINDRLNPNKRCPTLAEPEAATCPE
jgi:7-cyano-7-deazaguanine synthase in queuosine biosynthesis